MTKNTFITMPTAVRIALTASRKGRNEFAFSWSLAIGGWEVGPTLAVFAVARGRGQTYDGKEEDC